MENTVDTEVEDAVGVAVIDGAGEAVRDVVAESCTLTSESALSSLWKKKKTKKMW